MKSTKKCTVKNSKLTINEAKRLLNNQKNFNIDIDNSDINETALSKALTGSKRYLEHNKLV